MIKSAAKVAVLASLVYAVVHFYFFLGLHLQYYNSRPGVCKTVKGAPLGSEDLHVTSQGLTFITSGCNFATNSPAYHQYMEENNIKGRISLYDFKHPETGALELKIRPSESFSLSDFRPHGISVLEDSAKGEHLLYVVNHPFPRPDQVEKFRFNPSTKELVHLQSFTSDLLLTTNDLAVVDEDNFYISNYVASRSPAMAKVEALLRLPWCNILHYNGSGFVEVAPGLIAPNGLILSKDKKILYAAMPHELKVRVFRIAQDHTLSLHQAVPLTTLPDNLHLSQDGRTIYAGAHPIAYRTLNYIGNPGAFTAPSQVIALPLRDDGQVETDDVSQLFYDDGKLITASTVAAVYKDKLIVGSLLDTLVVCHTAGG